jgi:DNA-binding response OmpR family regulator
MRESESRRVLDCEFDLVVCDYRMPGKTGIDLLIELNRQQASVPVLVISAYADTQAENTIMQLGAVELMKKPIRRQELIARAARVIGSVVPPNGVQAR